MAHSEKARTTSVVLTVIISIVAATTLLLFGLGALMDRITSNQWWMNLHAEHAILADQLAESLVLPVWNFDDGQIGKIIESTMKNRNIAGITVRTLGKRPRVYVRMRDAQWRIIAADRVSTPDKPLLEEREIRFSGEAIGTVQVLATPRFIAASLTRTRLLIFAVLLPFELILALSLYVLLWRLVLRPLQEVEIYAVAVSSGNAAGGSFHPAHFRGELEQLRSSIETMVSQLKQHRAHLEEMVEARTGELSAANKKLKELDRLKSMFIASMSHELRTPLNSIIGFTGMTLQGLSGGLNDEQQDNLRRAYFSAKHLLNLITDVIDISKVEAGRIEAYPESFALKEIIDDALATIGTQLKDKGLTIEVDVPPDTTVYTDRKRLLQCLINLLSNAVKFTESGGVSIASRRADGQVFLSVRDTGIGIAARDLQRLFEPFERLETRLRVKAGGTGLGLYLTRKLAREVLRGEVSVESSEGRGSTFSIRIPEDLRQAPAASVEVGGGATV